VTELAKPTARIERRTEEPTLDLDTLVKQFMSKQEAFNEFMDILQLLHERGILTAFKAALSATRTCWVCGRLARGNGCPEPDKPLRTSERSG